MIDILEGDTRQLLPLLPDNSIQCVVTSPPYWQLRNYNCDGQIGMEEEIEDYVRELVAVFREVRRALRDDGTLWLNLGDSYASAWPCRRRNVIGTDSLPDGTRGARAPRMSGGLKEKDLCGIPWRVAFALQADGWYLRSDIIWAKGNPMPESVRDRPTRAHEYLFLLTKKPAYYYDIDAIREPHVSTTADQARAHTKGRGGKPATRAVLGAPRQDNCGGLGFSPLGRNRRSWWQVNTRPFKGAHFATFPPDLVRPCLQAGASLDGACAACGAPRRRVLEKGAPARAWQQACGSDPAGEYHGQATKDYASAKAQNASAVKARILEGMREVRTIGWVPSCTCQTVEVRPCVVLDPFGGAGTVGVVAQELGLSCLLIELNPEYAALARRRIGVPEECLSSISAKTPRSPSGPATTTTKPTATP